MASFGMLLPELPAHLAQMGGEAYLGGVVGMFTLAAFLSRFLSGRIADQAGRRKVMLIGSAVTAVAGFGYLVAQHWGVGSPLNLASNGCSLRRHCWAC